MHLIDIFHHRSWNTFRSDAENEELYNGNFSDDEKDVFRCHLFEIDHIHLLDSYDLSDLSAHKYIDPRNGAISKKLIIDMSTHANEFQLFNNFPKISEIPKWQHTVCMRVISRMKKRHGEGGTSIMTDYERQDLQKYMANWNVRQKERTAFLEFVKQYFYTKLMTRCRSLHPKLEQLLLDKRKKSIEQIKTNNNFEYLIQTALPLELCTNESILYEIDKPIQQYGHVSMYKKNAILEQTLNRSIKEFEIKQCNHPTTNLFNNVHFVMPTSVLRQLISGQFTDDWSISFTIKEDSSKVCFFNKPMPKKELNCMVRNQKAFKHWIKSNASDSSKMYSLHEHKFIYHTEDATLDLNFEIDGKSFTSDHFYKLIEFSEYMNKYLKNVQVPSKSKPKQGNISQRLLKLKDGLDEIKVLLSSKYDVCERTNDETTVFVNLSIKMEYQKEFGSEQMTLPELIDEWCKLCFQPESLLDRSD